MSLTKKDLNQIKGVVEEVSSRQTDDLAVIVSGEINRLENKMDDGFQTLGKKIDDMSGKINIHREILKDHEQRITVIEKTA